MPAPHNTKWEKIRKLGSGGQGSTFLVKNTENTEESERVLKELRDPGNEQALERFKKEIEIIEKIDHPSIISIIDYSIVSDPPFYVMEHHKGARTLADVILTQDANTNPYHGNVLKCLGLFEEIILAIQVCESQNPPVLHRDISPRNILLLENGKIILIDFGLSQSIGDTPITLTGENIGTRGYAPPECEAGRQEQVSTASDIYSAAKVLWSAMTSELAFARETPIFDNKSMVRMFFRKDETWHLNRIFERTIQNKQHDRLMDTESLLIIIEQLRELISNGFPPLEAVKNKCPSCGYWSIREYFLQENEIATAFVREGFLTFECEKCGFAFARKVKNLQKSLTQYRK